MYIYSAPQTLKSGETIQLIPCFNLTKSFNLIIIACIVTFTKLFFFKTLRLNIYIIYSSLLFINELSEFSILPLILLLYLNVFGKMLLLVSFCTAITYF